MNFIANLVTFVNFQLNVNLATKGYLEQYVKKKIESSTKPKDQEDTGGADKGEENVSDAEKSEASKTASEHPEPTPEDSNKDNEKENKENHDTSTFGLVTDEDKQADQEASEKLTDMIKERLKNKPLPPPPPPPQLLPTDAGGNLNVENHSRSKDGESDADAVKNGEFCGIIIFSPNPSLLCPFLLRPDLPEVASYYL